jgi:metallo-beta-lactamase family protein
MLQDCAHIQEKDLEFINKKRKKAGKKLFEPLYLFEDVVKTQEMMIGAGYHQELDITPEIRLTFYDAGHILGSAIVHLMIQEGDRVISLAFSGDLGRCNLPILRDPDKIPDVDYFICESTYGGRFHDTFTVSTEKMCEVLKKAAERKAKVIVPSFSVGRTQELVYILNELFDKGLAPRIPIYVDSPLSVNVTEVFRTHPECFDFETSRFIIKHKDPFGFSQFVYITKVEDSKELNERPGPCMIISSSGMAEAGRIVHHLANNIDNPNNMILIVGFCAENTLGRKIVEKVSPVNILGEPHEIKAEVVLFNSLSAHADSNELIQYSNIFDKKKMKNIFLVHGDLDQQEKLKTRLLESGFLSVTIPAKGDEINL